jgi:hypothetical protein
MIDNVDKDTILILAPILIFITVFHYFLGKRPEDRNSK